MLSHQPSPATHQFGCNKRTHRSKKNLVAKRVSLWAKGVRSDVPVPPKATTTLILWKLQHYKTVFYVIHLWIIIIYTCIIYYMYKYVAHHNLLKTIHPYEARKPSGPTVSYLGRYRWAQFRIIYLGSRFGRLSSTLRWSNHDWDPPKWNKDIPLPETNISLHLKIGRGPQKETRKYSNHPFSGAMLVLGRVTWIGAIVSTLDIR